MIVTMRKQWIQHVPENDKDVYFIKPYRTDYAGYFLTTAVIVKVSGNTLVQFLSNTCINLNIYNNKLSNPNNYYIPPLESYWNGIPMGPYSGNNIFFTFNDSSVETGISANNIYRPDIDFMTLVDKQEGYQCALLPLVCHINQDYYKQAVFICGSDGYTIPWVIQPKSAPVVQGVTFGYIGSNLRWIKEIYKSAIDNLSSEKITILKNVCDTFLISSIQKMYKSTVAIQDNGRFIQSFFAPEPKYIQPVITIPPNPSPSFVTQIFTLLGLF